MDYETIRLELIEELPEGRSTVRFMAGTNGMAEGVEAGVALLREAIDVLLAADLELDPATAGASEVVSVLRAVEVQRRRLDALDARLLATAGTRHAAAHLGRTSVPDMLMHALRLGPGEARARARRAIDLGPRRVLTGEPLEPIHPRLAAAQVAGLVSGVQIDMITKAIGRIPADIAVIATPVAEDCLTEAAAHEGPRELRQTIDALLTRIAPDGDEPRDAAVERARFCHLTRRGDASWTLRGTLTDETGLIWRTIIDSLAAPAPAGQRAATGERSSTGDLFGIGELSSASDAAGGAGTALVRDDRSPGQREHDALRELGERLLRSGTLPDAGGAALTVLVRADLSDLADPAGVLTTEHGHTVRARNLLQLAGDAELVPVLFDRTRRGRPLWLGRSRRLATRAQRRALAARDGGCSFPACTRPASWCQVHHIIEWQHGGTTDIDNMTLLCGYHHRHFENAGWSVHSQDGRPTWRPPPWIDPRQHPVTNNVHHLPEISFRPDGHVVARR